MIKGIITGIRAYFGAFQLISKLKLWKYFGVPMLISLLLAIAIGGFAYSFSDNIGAFLGSFWPWEWGKETFQTISSVFGGLLIVILGLIIFKHLILALSAPFMGPISEKIEEHLLGESSNKKQSSFVGLLMRGIHVSARNLIKELLLSVVILLIGLIPVIGLISAFLLFLVQAYYAGFGNMDYTLERHFDYKNSVRFVRQNRGSALGNGIVFILFLLIPVIGVILVLPFSVTAATTETIKLIHNKNV